MQDSFGSFTRCVHYMINENITLSTTKMNPKSEYTNRQQYRQPTTTINNNHKFTIGMQDIVLMCGEIREYPKALEKALILSSDSK